MDSLFADDEDNFDIDSTADMEAEVDAAAPPAAALDITPKTNPDLMGHEDIEAALLADYNAGRMPHAIVLAGPAGIGKATLAYRLARFLLAQGMGQDAGLFGEPAKPESLYLAPEDPVFRRVSSGGHSDLLVIEREFDEKKGRFKNDITIDAVRRAHPFVRKTAAEEGWRVIVIDGAEYLNRSSQNALLKILEEPPKKTVLILTTSQPGAFLPTIRSRCRMVPMKSLSENVLGKLIDKMIPAISLPEKNALTRLSDGSIGRAMQFFEDDGVILYKTLLKIASTLPALDIVAVHDLAEAIGRAGTEQAYETARDILTGWCERLARLQARGIPLTDVLQGDAEIFQRLTAAYPPRHFLDTWEKMAQLFLQTENYNLDKRQAIINAFLMLQKPNYPGLNI